MRRLPVYLLLDTSYSMAGEPLTAVEQGVDLLLSTLRRDPYALETAHLSVITFDEQARQIAPLTELPLFQAPSLKAQGTTALGAALTLLAQCIRTEVATTTPQTKGDWKPLIFIMTDGVPTDDWRAGQAALSQVRTGVVVACAAGRDADTSILRELTDAVVQLDTADAERIAAFFKWISASISTGSQKVDLTKKDLSQLGDLPPPPPEVNIVL